MTSGLHVPLDLSITSTGDIPYTISFVVRKRQQLDGLQELPKDKRPPEEMIWNGTSDELDRWLDTVFSTDQKNDGITITADMIEG